MMTPHQSTRATAIRRAVLPYLRRHWLFVAVFALAVALRVCVAVAYHPALFFSDSLGYLAMADKGFPVGIAPTRPSGYPLLIDLVAFGKSLQALTIAQHAAGLATGVLVYALLTWARVARWLAACAAGLVLLESYGVALEQHVLSETFFALFITASTFLAIRSARDGRAIAASGLLLAASATMRPQALFVIPVWIGYVLLRNHNLRVLGLAVVCACAPVALYAGLHAAKTGEFGLTQSDGWFLYGRVAQIADCAHLKPTPAAERLCTGPGSGPNRDVSYYVWGRASPAHRVFGGISADPVQQSHSNAQLRAFALTVIEAEPVQYAGLVTDDFFRYFEPGETPWSYDQTSITLPDSASMAQVMIGTDRREVVSQSTGGQPAKLLGTFQSLSRPPRLLFALLSILSLGGLLVRNAGQGDSVGRAGIALLAGSFFAILLGSAASSDFAMRYLVPEIPLIVGAGIFGARRLLLAVRLSRRLPIQKPNTA
jgi:hypothetical protein